MWKILKIKSPEAGKYLNEPDRIKIESKAEPRRDVLLKRDYVLKMDFLLKMASAIKLMDSEKHGVRIRGLTCETANAFYRTLHAIVYIIKNF